jgi:glycerol-3-phosphate dehydrogenase
VAGHPILEAEVVYAARHEFCETANDFLARRSRLAFLDVASAKKARTALPPPPPALPGRCRRARLA